MEASIQLEKLYFEAESLYQMSKLNTSICQRRKMINVADLIIQQSLLRKENRGGYYNEDYSKKILKKII